MLWQGIQPDSNCASKSIGYRQAMHYLRQCTLDPTHISAPDLVCSPFEQVCHPSIMLPCCIALQGCAYQDLFDLSCGGVSACVCVCMAVRACVHV